MTISNVTPGAGQRIGSLLGNNQFLVAGMDDVRSVLTSRVQLSIKLGASNKSIADRVNMTITALNDYSKHAYSLAGNLTITQHAKHVEAKAVAVKAAKVVDDLYSYAEAKAKEGGEKPKSSPGGDAFQ
ncbi:hypothetical protein [Paenirhodobacter sp.]|uniref:hypothetical protein n=1 Tax=Paenirhodobacter sp. TaxID=1965326 RepID=UPI003B40C83A